MPTLMSYNKLNYHQIVTIYKLAQNSRRKTFAKARNSVKAKGLVLGRHTFQNATQIGENWR